VTAQNNLSAINQSLAKASKISDLSKLVAPADAVVLKIGKANIGSVIDPSTDNTEPLFTLTPLGGKLQAELHISSRDIGFIKPGDKVRLKLDAYQFTSHGTATGVLRTISDGSFTTTDDGQVVQPYYKATVAITDMKLRNVPANFKLTPGLTLTGEVLIGKRTIMQYLFSGALRTGSEAMREPS
jgi:multidrug resistance efflux pump